MTALAELAAQALADRVALEATEQAETRQAFIDAASAFVAGALDVNLAVLDLTVGVVAVFGDNTAAVAARPAGDTWQLNAVQLVDGGWTDLGAVGSLADLGAILKAAL